MKSIDCERFINSIIEFYGDNIPTVYAEALKDQGLCYKNGKIVPLITFQKGDWISINGHEYRIEEMKDSFCIVSNKEGDNSHIWLTDLISSAEVWDVRKHAKDGECLFNYHNGDLFIFKGFTSHDSVLGYFSLKNIDETQFYYIHTLRPATEEERTQLLESLKDRGYAWDSENLEVKKLSEMERRICDTRAIIAESASSWLMSHIEEYVEDDGINEQLFKDFKKHILGK